MIEKQILLLAYTFVLMCYMVTNVAIVANAMRHWNNIDKPSESTLESSVTCPKP